MRALLTRQLWTEAIFVGLAIALAVAVGAGFAGLKSPLAARLLLALAPLLFAGALVVLGVFRITARLGDDALTARWVGERAPELQRDVLAAVELSRELAREGEKAGFSRELAGAFLKGVDARAAGVQPHRLLDHRPTQATGIALGVTALICLTLVAVWPRSWVRGLKASLGRPSATRGPTAREPITGDVELTYRYPAYTGLTSRTVGGTNGEISAPAGTEVQLRTRADREVERADAIVDGKRVPLQVSGGRDLVGSFVVQKSGAYHFAFFRLSDAPIAEGPDRTITAEADAPPQVSLQAPAEDLEIDPGQKVSLRFEASDDYGLGALELVYRAPGQPEEQRVPLRHDEGRRTKGQHSWDITQIALKPGQQISYFVEARDNDAIGGPKKGVSRTQTLRLYSAAEHRREAVRKAEQLWERLVDHLGDRMESPDRDREKDAEKVNRGQPIDTGGIALAQDMTSTAQELARERDAPEELFAALANIGQTFRRHVASTQDARRLWVRFSKLQGSDFDSGKRLITAATSEIGETEKSVLYLESLLDREKMKSLKELADQLQRDRRELASLIEQYKQTQNEQTRDSILREVNNMRQRLDELMQRMSELAKGIRDEHLNQEALKEMMEQEDMSSQLDQIEKLMREGKADEALAKLQELAMEMEEMLQGLEEADDSGGEDFPELTEKFKEFTEELKKTTDAQQKTAEETRELRDRYRQQMKDRLAQRGQQLKEELIKKADEVAKSYQQLSGEPLSSRADRPMEEAQSELENVKNALKVDDFDLAAEAASRADRAAQELAAYGEQQRQLDEIFQNPPESRGANRETADRLQRDASKVSEIARKLQQLFPPPGSMLSEADKNKLKQLAQEQGGLEKQAQGLQQKMEQIGQMAPIFNEEAQEQMEQIGQRMGDASQRLNGKDPGRGFGEQKAALEQLQAFQQQMQQSMQQNKGKGKGLPLPMFAGRRGGWGQQQDEKVEIPDEDQFQAPKEFRKDLLDAMKEGAPDKYRDQVKRYYEELVK